MSHLDSIYSAHTAANLHGSLARDLERRCVQCPPTTPTCPTCKKSEICSLVPQTCDECQHMTCISNPAPAPSQGKSSIGAIAGGVVGGIAAIALIVFLVWRFWIKKRRAEQELELEHEEEWEGDDIARQKSRGSHRFTETHGDAGSTRTRGSMANSFLSRASNIIQIAYIPGVTNRNGASGHNSLLGPVPPVPAARRVGQPPPKSPLSNEGDMLFFRPGDLRDSSYSATSSLRSAPGNRDTQYTRQSITPSLARSSVASDVLFRDDAAAIPMPATTLVRAAPRMVSVKSTASTSPGDGVDDSSLPSTTEHADFATAATGKGKGIQIMMPGERPSNGSSSSLLSAGGSQFVKPKQVTVGTGKGRVPVRQASDASSTTAASLRSRNKPNVSSPLAEVDSEEETEEPRSDSTSTGNTAPLIPPVQPLESPFFDASESPTHSQTGSPPRPNPYASMAKSVGTNLDQRAKRGARDNKGLSDIIEEATRRASRVPSHEGLGGRSPFSDVHEAD